MSDVPIQIPLGEMPTAAQLAIVIEEALGRGDARTLAVLQALDAAARLALSPSPAPPEEPSEPTIDDKLGLHRHLRVTYEVDQYRAEVCDDNDVPAAEAIGPSVSEAIRLLATAPLENAERAAASGDVSEEDVPSDEDVWGLIAAVNGKMTVSTNMERFERIRAWLRGFAQRVLDAASRPSPEAREDAGRATQRAPEPGGET